jgi:predicted nucleic acid-binding protein
VAGVIIVDASVLIGYLDRTDAHHGAAVDLLAREIEDDLAASSLTLAEVYVGPAKTGRLEQAVAAVRDLEVVERPLPASGAISLAELRARSGLRLPDCCVLLLAQEARGLVASFDKRLLKAARGLGLGAVAP